MDLLQISKVQKCVYKFFMNMNNKRQQIMRCTYKSLIVSRVNIPRCCSLVIVTSIAGLTCMIENGYIVILGKMTAIYTTVLDVATSAVHHMIESSSNAIEQSCRIFCGCVQILCYRTVQVIFISMN